MLRASSFRHSETFKTTSTKQRWICAHSVHPIAKALELPRPSGGQCSREEYRALALSQVAVNLYFDCCTHSYFGEVILKILHRFQRQT